MENTIITSPNAKSDYSTLGECVGELRAILPYAVKTNEKIEIIKQMALTIEKRINLRIQERHDAIANLQIDEYNRKVGTQFKIRNLELKKFDEHE